MFQAHVYGHLSDFADYGIEESLDAVQAIGAAGVIVNVLSGPRTALRSRPGDGPRLFRSGGGFFFQPDADHYADTHLKPITSTWLRQRNPLDKLVERCKGRDLDVRLRIDALEVGRIAARHPEAAAATVFDDVSTETLCPANPDVRALIRAAVRDLAARYQPTAIELEGMLYHSGFYCTRPAPDIGMEAGDVVMMLLATCFSASSRQAADERGVDAEAAAKWARKALDRALEQGDPDDGRLADEFADSAVMGAYLECQEQILDAWLGDIAGKAGVDLGVVPPDDYVPGAAPSTACARQMAAIIEESELETPGEVETYVEALRERWGRTEAIFVDIDMGSELAETAHAVVATVSALAEHGIQHVVFSDFGLIPPKRFTALKQAIRYAVRSTS